MNDERPRTELISRMQHWYSSNCDGEWEHSYGIRIETLDNPGWKIEINLHGTKLEGAVFLPLKVERSHTDWFQCAVKDDIFSGVGGPLNLEEMLTKFLQWSDSASDLSATKQDGVERDPA